MTKLAQNRWLRLAAFLVIHGTIIGSAFGWARWRLRQVEARRSLPEARTEPVRVLPRRNLPEAVSDEQLRRVLFKLRPRFGFREPKINHVDHALRFWGLEAAFADPDCLAGVEMLKLLLDHRRFNRAWGDEARPFLTRTRYGVRPRVKRGPATASHVDHTLASVAEVGTPIDYPVILPESETTVRAVFEDALRSFSLNQAEYEWSTLAFALYMPTDGQWMTEEGQYVSFDRLAERIMREELTEGVCYGNHRLHTLVMLLRVDEQTPLLSDAMRGRIVAHLRGALKQLVAHQREDGYWNRNWDGSAVSGSVPAGEVLSRRILATGHALEWLALAPQEIRPPRAMIVDAAAWLVRTIEEMPEYEIRAGYTFLSHAGRALALWRGRFPAEVELGAVETAGLDGQSPGSRTGFAVRQRSVSPMLTDGINAALRANGGHRCSPVVFCKGLRPSRSRKFLHVGSRREAACL